MATIPGPEPHAARLDGMLRAAKRIEELSRQRDVTLTEAGDIANRDGIDLGLVLGHLALIESCSVDYARGVIRCRK